MAGDRSASPPAARVTTRSQKDQQEPTSAYKTSAKLFDEAKTLIKDRQAAIAFLVSKKLIPDAFDHGPEALISGLLHFAAATPSNALATKGLIAFAHLAKEVLEDQRNEQLASRIAQEVAERTEEGFNNRLDDVRANLEETEAALKDCVGKLEVLGENVKASQDGRGAEQRELTTGTPSSGTPPSYARVASLPPSLAPPPSRILARAERMERQVLFRNVPLRDERGDRISEQVALQKAQSAIDLLRSGDLDIPNPLKFIAASFLERGDIVYELATKEAAHWFNTPANATAFERALGGGAFVHRTFKLVAEFVPTTFAPGTDEALRKVEDLNDLPHKAIADARWIKPPEKRTPGQKTAHLLLSFREAKHANQAVSGLIIAGKRTTVRRDRNEPRRCMRCQNFADHLARDCPQQHDTCANCAGTHPTSQCTAKLPDDLKCANCKETGHAAWDRDCPTFRRRARALAARNANTGFRYFITDDPRTWESEEQELARAPPPATAWSQIRHALEPREDDPTSRPRPSYYTQTKLPWRPTQRSESRSRLRN